MSDFHHVNYYMSVFDLTWVCHSGRLYFCSSTGPMWGV